MFKGTKPTLQEPVHKHILQEHLLKVTSKDHLLKLTLLLEPQHKLHKLTLQELPHKLTLQDQFHKLTLLGQMDSHILQERPQRRLTLQELPQHSHIPPEPPCKLTLQEHLHRLLWSILILNNNLIQNMLIPVSNQASQGQNILMVQNLL